jgi:hypothetical protein
VKTGLGVISRELQFEAHFFAATFGVLRLSMAGMRARKEKDDFVWWGSTTAHGKQSAPAKTF